MLPDEIEKLFQGYTISSGQLMEGVQLELIEWDAIVLSQNCLQALSVAFPWRWILWQLILLSTDSQSLQSTGHGPAGCAGEQNNLPDGKAAGGQTLDQTIPVLG